MHIKLDKKKCSILFAYGIICLCIFGYSLTIYEGNYDSHTFGLTIILPFFVISILAIFLSRIKLYSFYALLFILTFILHFGQLIVCAISPEFMIDFDIAKQLNFDEYYSAQLFSLAYISVYVLSGIIFNKQEDSTKIVKLKTDDRKSMIVLMWVCLTIFLPLQLYYWYESIMIRVVGEYTDIYLTTNISFFEIFAKFHLIGILCLLLYYKEKQKFCKAILILYSSVVLISMFSGGRMYAISLFLVTIFFYLFINNVNIKIKNVIIGFVLIMLIFNMMSAIANVRSNKVENLSNLFVVIKDQDIENPMLKFMSEMGGTQFTVGLLMRQMEAGKIEQAYGKSYLVGLLSVLPNINGKIKKIGDDNNFVIQLRYPTLGGSIIAESFYNFKWFGVFVASILAWILLGLERKMKKVSNSKNVTKIFYYMMILYSIILWQRNIFSIVPRYIFYTYLLIFICKRIKVNKTNF